MPSGSAMSLGMMLEVVVNSSGNARLSANPYPRDLQGIWFSDEHDVRT